MKRHRYLASAQCALALAGIVTAWHCGAKGGNTNTIQNAAWCGDIPRAQRYLAANPQLLQSKEGVGALDAAAQNGQSEMAAFLISQGADLNERGFEGMTPLARAASLYSIKDDTKSAAVAAALIAHGADIDPVDEYGDTPLLHAVESRKARVAEVLLQNSTNQAADQLRTYRGANSMETALHMAIRENDQDTVAVLLQYHPPLDAWNREDQTPLVEAIAYDRTEIIKLICEAAHQTNDVPSVADMRAIGLRIADGDDSALQQLSAIDTQLQTQIPVDHNPYPHVPDAWIRIKYSRMNTAFKAAGEAIGQGNQKSMPMLEQKIAAGDPAAQFALEIFTYAAAAGNQGALTVLTGAPAQTAGFNSWLLRPAAANIGPAVDYYVDWLKQAKPEDRGGLILMVTNALGEAATKGNQKAQTAVEQYAANPF